MGPQPADTRRGRPRQVPPHVPRSAPRRTTANGYLSGYQLANASGVSVSTVNHLVHNRRRTASAETVRRTREALGRSADDLFVLEKSPVRVDHGRAA